MDDYEYRFNEITNIDRHLFPQATPSLDHGIPKVDEWMQNEAFINETLSYAAYRGIFSIFYPQRKNNIPSSFRFQKPITRFGYMLPNSKF